MGNEKQRKETQVTETQEGQETVLDQIMSNVTLADPLEIPLKSGQILTITQEQFISYYLPSDASRTEKANCFNEVKAAGLNPAIRNDCHFFRTQGQPMHLFIGYHVYLRHAYANGLIHIQKPAIEYGEDGNPHSCTVTLEIEGRSELEWETIFWEVAATNRDGKLNARWQKAPVQMLKKCALVAALRVSGLVDFTLPPAVEEMGVPVAPGHRTLTQSQLDVYGPQEGEEGATVGEVSATHHQLDMSPFRKKYFKALKAQGILQDDATRREWQKEFICIESTSGWNVECYALAFELIATGEARTWAEGYTAEPDDYDPETEPVDGMSPEAQDKEAEEQEDHQGFDHMEPEADAPLNNQGEPDWDQVKAEAEAEQADLAAGSDPELEGLHNDYDTASADMFETQTALNDWESIISPDVAISKWDAVKYRASIAGLKALKDARVEVKDVTDREALMKLYMEVIKGIWECTQDMTQFQRKVAGHNSFQDFDINELRSAYIVARSLKAVQVASADVATEVTEDFQVEDSEPEKPAQNAQASTEPDANLPFLITDDTVKEIREALLKFPDLKYKTIRSRAFREFAFKAIEHEYVSFRKLLDTDGKLILDKLSAELAELTTPAYIHDPAAKTTDVQMAETKSLVADMPERFHQSIGSTEFQSLVSNVIGRPHRGFGTVSALEAAKVIESMKEIIQEEVNE